MNFLKTAFLPDGEVSLVMVDYRISPAIEANLKKRGIACIKTVRCPDLYDAVDGHPDMLMFHLGGNRIILAPNIYEEMAPKLEKKRICSDKGCNLAG